MIIQAATGIEMPEVHREEGMVWMIYVHDHSPEHVHVRTQQGTIRLFLDDEASVAKVGKDVKDSDVKKARRITREQRVTLLAAWAAIHETT